MTIDRTKDYPSRVLLGRNTSIILGVTIAILAAFNSILLSKNATSGSTLQTNSSINDLWITAAEYPLAAIKDVVEDAVVANSHEQRRTRAHFCQEPWCGKLVPGRRRNRTVRALCRSIGQRLLEEEFGFESVDAKAPNTSWDVIFGGHIYCGEPFEADVGMRFGLNRLLNEQGWDTLRASQVWFPCMGCGQSYCNKVELCRYLQSMDPTSCFILPRDGERWKQAMNDNTIYVVKGTGVLTHDTHSGRSITYARTSSQADRLMNTRGTNKSQNYAFIAQRFVEPFLGVGDYRRKAELQIYLAMTSTSPLRVYMYDEWVCILAASQYTDSISAIRAPCMLDSHMKGRCKDKTTMNRRITFQQYADAVEFNATERTQLIDAVATILLSTFHAAQPAFASHYVNQGIQLSNASCFSYMRADFGIAYDKTPHLFEINELPDKVGDGYNRSDVSFRVREESLRDLFRMVGLDKSPLPVDRRADYEAKHHGGWRLLS